MSIVHNQFWVLRQNYGERTNQKNMRDFVLNTHFVTCPWGGWGENRTKVINGTFNEKTSDDKCKWTSRGQDRKFVQEMNIGDIVLIPFTRQRTCIVARITSGVEYGIDTGMFWRLSNDKVKIDVAGGEPFRPVGRRIEILNADFLKPPHLGRQTLTKLRPDLVNKLNF
jgi:hypothetical protein